MKPTSRFLLFTLVAGAMAIVTGALGQSAEAEMAALGAVNEIAELKAQIASAQLSADNAWLMTSSALVLMMTAPGLILFYGGLVRSKNVLSVLMQSIFLMGLVSIAWLVFGYSLAFGNNEGALGAFIGNFDYLFLKGVGTEPGPFGDTIPHQTFMFFQMMFAIITPALMTGAFAERFRFKAMVPFMLLWLVVVYIPICHMVWGPNGYLGGLGAMDFAGGTVVHISSGVSALVCALYIGKRRGFPGAEFVPHSLVLSAIGAGLLWVGWFGFNAGSALNAGGDAAGAFTATHFSAAAAALAWITCEWLLRGKPSLLGAVSGIVAGLVAVTPAAGFVSPVGGMIIGFLGGAVCFVAVTMLKPKLGFDDSLDVFGVHGIGGMAGAILTGVLAVEGGLVSGGGIGQVWVQAWSVIVTIGLSVVSTIVLLVLVDKTIGIRPTEEDEITGLDIVDHGESAYHQLTA